jgi:DNA polymerase III alpha subunit
MGLMRGDLGPEILRSADLEQAGNGSLVEVAGMVVARQRPETARGIVFMLVEDERGTVNLIVPPAVYERCRAAVRAAPLVRARGKLERHEGNTNVVVSEVAELERPTQTHHRRASKRSISRLSGPSAGRSRKSPPKPPRRRVRERAVAELRAVAPSGHSFGRRS